MGLTYVTVKISPAADEQGKGQAYEASFLPDAGATDTVSPEDKLQEIGLKPVGRRWRSSFETEA